MKDKVYKVTIGQLESKFDDILHFDDKNVVAKDVPSAMRQIKLKKKQYISSVEFITTLDKI